MSKLKLQATGAAAAKFAHIGTVVDVIAAVLPPELAHKRFDAKAFDCAFELGTPRDANSLGETIILNGTCYTTSTDAASPDFYRTIHGSTFMTSGIFILPHEQKPAYLINQELAEPIEVLAMYDEIYQKMQQPFAFIGVLELEKFHGTAVCKAPIDGHDIFKHKAEYYAKPEINTENVHVFIMGVVTDYQDVKSSEVNRQLEVVLYRNPFDVSNALTHHAHVLTLKKSISDRHKITISDAKDSLHLFADGSLIKRLNLEVYAVGSVEDFQKFN